MDRVWAFRTEFEKEFDFLFALKLRLFFHYSIQPPCIVWSLDIKTMFSNRKVQKSVADGILKST